jgi:hypothetical protein
MKEVTRDDIVRALRENGIKQGFHIEFLLIEEDKKLSHWIDYITAKALGPEKVLMCGIGKIRFKLEIDHEDINYAISPYGRQIPDLIYMNDKLRMTFEEMAKEIETWQLVVVFPLHL